MISLFMFEVFPQPARLFHAGSPFGAGPRMRTYESAIKKDAETASMRNYFLIYLSTTATLSVSA